MSDVPTLDHKICTIIDRANFPELKTLCFKISSTDTPSSIIEAISTHFGYPAFDLYEGESLRVKSYDSFNHEGWHEIRPAGLELPRDPIGKIIEEFSLQKGQSVVIDARNRGDYAQFLGDPMIRKR
ncbi:16297_t:CDS:1, partial [Acaulospora morrowiae]